MFTVMFGSAVLTYLIAIVVAFGLTLYHPQTTQALFSIPVVLSLITVLIIPLQAPALFAATHPSTKVELTIFVIDVIILII